MRDTNRYHVDVCCLHEAKIKHASSYEINGSTIITFHSDNRHYGNGFVIAKKWKNSIHKCWKVSDRIWVIQFQLKTNLEGKDVLYESEPISDTWIKISKLITKDKYRKSRWYEIEDWKSESESKTFYQHHQCLCTNLRKSKEIC